MRRSRAQALESHYRREGDYYLIEIKLSSVRRLFNSFDPAPFLDRDLNDEAENYIVSTVREFPPATPLRLLVYLPKEEVEAERATLEMAIHNYFDYRYQAAGRELQQFLRQGRQSLVIGLTVLFAAIAGFRVLEALGDSLWVEILAEGLLIGGWVAMWHPIETFLYAWRPLAKRRRVYAKLRDMPVEVRESV